MDKRTKKYKAAVAALKALDAAPTVERPLADARRRLTEKKAKPKQTKAQKLAQTAKARATFIANKPMTLQLTCPHWVGGISYGPGAVSVPKDLAVVLLENERRVRENNEAFDGHKAAFIGPRNRVMPVPYDIFSSPMLNVMEAMTL